MGNFICIYIGGGRSINLGGGGRGGGGGRNSSGREYKTGIMKIFTNFTT